MDSLRRNYEKLCSKEDDIMKKLTGVEEKLKRPKERVLQWLDDVERVKKEVNDIQESSLISRYIFIPKRRFRVLKAKISILQLQGNSYLAYGLSGIRIKQVGSFPNRSQLLDTIMESVMNPSVLITSVKGRRGVGKTMAMRDIRNQLATSEHFDKIFWVTLPKKLSLHKLQSELALQIKLDLCMHEGVFQRGAILFENLMRIKNYLIIFDNLWQKFSLLELGVPQPHSENGCRIVLTTPDFEVCRGMVSDSIITVDILSKEEAWNLFVSKAGNMVLTPEIQPFARKMVNLCHGLPIEIVSAGYAMRDEVSVDVWRKTIHDLNSLGKGGEAFKVLKFIYYRLSSTMVQNCFLFCAFFRGNYHFKPEELIRYWMAEKLIHVEGDMVSEIDEGFKILRELHDARMLDMFTERGEEWLSIHDMFRDLAIQILKEEPGLYVETGLGLQNFPTRIHNSKAKKISLMGNNIESLDRYMCVPSSVSTLLLQDNPISYIAPLFFHHMHALEFLDISYSWITELPTTLSQLAQLRVLFLHYCTGLQIIPSLERMKELQVLNLCGTAITELPQGMEGLVSLRSLDLSETKRLKSIRVGVISSLSCLEEFRLHGSGFIRQISHTDGNYLEELRSLKKLAILTLSIVGYGNHLDTIMCLKEKNLKIFSINVFGSVEDYIEDMQSDTE